MIYDMRIYTAHSGKERAMIDRFVNVVVPIFSRLGIDVVNIYETQEDAPRLVYVTRFECEEDRATAWNAFKMDAEWGDAKAASEWNGPLLKHQEISVLKQLVAVGA